MEQQNLGRFDVNAPGHPDQQSEIKLNRAARRRIRFFRKHHPEFTKKFSTEHAKTKKQKKERQLNAMKKRLVAREVWDEMKWKVHPDYIAELAEYKKQEFDKLNSV